MADYIYTMEIRLTPDQLKGVGLVQDVARAAGMNLYLTGGAIRDIISGFSIRDLDFRVQCNPLKLQKDFERRGEDYRRRGRHSYYLPLAAQRQRACRSQHGAYGKIRKDRQASNRDAGDDSRGPTPPRFHDNAMALSLNEGSRGLLLDPFDRRRRY